MDIVITKDCKFSLNGLTVLAFKKGKNISNPTAELIEGLGENFKEVKEVKEVKAS